MGCQYLSGMRRVPKLGDEQPSSGVSTKQRLRLTRKGGRVQRVRARKGGWGALVEKIQSRGDRKWWW